jgi:lysophospholipase L1-like esterase
MSRALCLLLLTAACGAAPLSDLPAGAKVLFQGDSITDCGRGRTSDPNHILGHGYAFIIAARNGSARPAQGVEYVNRGVSGNTVLDLRKRWKADAMDVAPDVLSVLIGANDSGRSVDPLLTETRKARPGLRIVLCEPFLAPDGPAIRKSPGRSERMKALQAACRRLADKHRAVFVPLQSVFDDASKKAPWTHWIWDGVHPTAAGHQLIADAWERSFNGNAR